MITCYSCPRNLLHRSVERIQVASCKSSRKFAQGLLTIATGTPCHQRLSHSASRVLKPTPSACDFAAPAPSSTSLSSVGRRKPYITALPVSQGPAHLAMPNTHAEIIAQLPARFERAQEEGDLFFFPSTTHKHQAHGVEYEIRLCPALQNKPALPTPHFDAASNQRRVILEREGKWQDPFAPPYVPNLLLGDLKDEEEDTEYVVLFNKFSIVPHHILLVTREYHSQSSPLMPSDLVQTYLFLIAAQKAGRRFFAFYNCGDMSGASQHHKHLQLVPLEDDGPPVERLARFKTLEVLERPFTIEDLTYANHVRRFPAFLPNASLSELESILSRAFLSLLDLAISTYRRDPTPEATDAPTKGFKSSLSYNVLITLDHMHIIPRKFETYTLKETGETMNINAMGFAGCLLVKSEKELDAVLKEGVGEILAGVGCKSIHEQQCEGACSL